MTAEQLFPTTVMPDDDWWHALWPDPHKALRDIGITTGMSSSLPASGLIGW